MNISEKIDKYVAEVGKGDIRDALNIALNRIDQLRNENWRLRNEVAKLSRNLIGGAVCDQCDDMCPEDQVVDGLCDECRKETEWQHSLANQGQ